MNAWIFSGKRMEKVAPGTALHVHITSPNDLCYFKDPYSLKQQNNQNPQGHYRKHKDTNNKLYSCVWECWMRWEEIILLTIAI